MDRVIAYLPDSPQSRVPNKYDIMEVLTQTQSSMDPNFHAKIARLLRTSSEVFSKSEWNVGRCELVKHRIDLYPSSKPIKLPNRRMPMHFEADLRQNIDKFLEHKPITPCHSPYSSPAMLDPMENVKLRLVIDYRQLNKQTFKSCWPLRSVEENFDRLEASCYFSTIDMSWGFYELLLEESSQYLTDFSTPLGSFKWLLMPMGLTGSLSVFQSLMERVLVGLTWKSTIPYLDDSIIFSCTADEHIARLREVLQRFKDTNLKINPLKYEFFRQHRIFLGHVVSRDGIQADPAKTSAVRQYRIPTSVTEVKSFLGLCSYYRRYVRKFASIARPLHHLTEKTREFHLTPEAQQNFKQLKDCLTSSPILAFPSMKEPFILYTDASQFANGTILSQVQHGLERIICYASKALNKAQSCYSTTKREFLAVVNYTKHFKHYFLGRRFKIMADHGALQWLHNFKEPDVLTTRWLEKLAAFEYEIEHRSGKSSGHADCMSRLPAQPAALNVTTITEICKDEENLSPPTGQEAPAHLSTNTTIPRYSRREISTEKEQSEVHHGYNAGDRKTGSKMTMIEQQGNLLDFEHSIAHCISVDFKPGAGIASQIREKFPSSLPRKARRNHALHVQSLGQNIYVYHFITKPRH